MRFLTLVLASFLITTSTFAQTLSPDIAIDMIPSNPAAGSTVTLTARSFGVDLSQATMSWTYNGKVVVEAIGRTSISVIAPANGTTAVATVRVGGIGLETASASVAIRPGSIDLLWEAADAYTPPFYKGKALVPVGGLIRATAIPTAAAPKNLSFDWTRNGQALETVSGYNRSSITLRHDPLNAAETLGVEARSGTFSGTNSLRLTPFAPLAIAYQNKEGFIDYARGFANQINLVTGGIVLHLEPYYFSAPKGINDLTFTTTIDGEIVSPSQQNELGLSRPASDGQSLINLAITTDAYSLQHLEKTFTLLFN